MAFGRCRILRKLDGCRLPGLPKLHLLSLLDGILGILKSSYPGSQGGGRRQRRALGMHIGQLAQTLIQIWRRQLTRNWECCLVWSMHGRQSWLSNKKIAAATTGFSA